MEGEDRKYKTEAGPPRLSDSQFRTSRSLLNKQEAFSSALNSSFLSESQRTRSAVCTEGIPAFGGDDPEHAEQNVKSSAGPKEKPWDRFLHSRLFRSIQIISFRPGMKLFSDPANSQISFKLTTCSAFLLLLLSLFIIGEMAVSNLFDIGTKVELRYQYEAPNHKEVNLTREEILQYFWFNIEAPATKTSDGFIVKWTGKDLNATTEEQMTSFKATVCQQFSAGIVSVNNMDMCFYPMKCAIMTLFDDHHSSDSRILLNVSLALDHLVPKIFEDISKEDIFPVNISDIRAHEIANLKECPGDYQMPVVPLQRFTTINAYFFLRILDDILDYENTNFVFQFVNINFAQRQEIMESASYNNSKALPTYETFYDVVMTEKKDDLTNHKNFFKRIWKAFNLFRNNTEISTTFTFTSIRQSKLGGIMNNEGDLFHEQWYFVYPNYPYVKQSIAYYGLRDYLAQIGGYLSIWKIFLAFIVSFFIYKEYATYMAEYLYQQDLLSGRVPSSENREVAVARVREQFTSRLSQEGIYRLFDRLEQQEKKIEELSAEIQQLKGNRSEQRE